MCLMCEADDVISRLEANTRIVPNPPRPDGRQIGPCFEWTGGRNHDGYGAMRVRTGEGARNAANSKVYYTHRLSAHLFHEMDLEGPDLSTHECDNRLCWNPAHLRPGTVLFNNQDCIAKGRWHRGILEPERGYIRRKLRDGKTVAQISYAIRARTGTLVGYSCVLEFVRKLRDEDRAKARTRRARRRAELAAAAVAARRPARAAG